MTITLTLKCALIAFQISFIISQSNSNNGFWPLNRPASVVRGEAPRDTATTRLSDGRNDEIPYNSKSGAFFKQRQEREQLYEAYNLLHTLAQDFHKPFDAPAVLVVGHQTSGKSALIEALMGFQFNQVGGGTKTRRPIALRMQYNPKCSVPLCFLTLENGKEEQRTLTDIQAYIEAENKRLEKDPSRCFDSKEINIRMEYRFCPNMIVIDTPGMLHPPKGRQLTPQQKALAQAAREAEALVLSKMRCQDYIILCVEDTTDWKHATTRNIVMQADPDFSRTVLVTTKLDTKLPQFSEAVDLEDFLRAPLVHRLYPRILGGPYFTSVPSGRVGLSKDYGSNEAFVTAIKEAEARDRGMTLQKLGNIPSRASLQNVGISRLRTFLETQVEDCYRRNVAKIVPLLQSELRLAETKLAATEDELSALSLERLKKGANLFRELFSKELTNAIHGSVKASPEDWGESLETEQLRGGYFVDQDQVQSHSWQALVEHEVGGIKSRLFGGAQYHRALREFAVAVRFMRTQPVTEDEIQNAAGMGDVHDGVNFMRSACVIAVEKAQTTFEPMLEALRHRMVHIMRRLFPIVEYMLRRGGSALLQETHTRPFQAMVRRIYDKFVEEQVKCCLDKCRDDLRGMTRFVTWDMDGRGSNSLYKALPTPKKMVEIYSVAVERDKEKQFRGRDRDSGSLPASGSNSGGNAKRLKGGSGGDKGSGGGGASGNSPSSKILDEWSAASSTSGGSDGGSAGGAVVPGGDRDGYGRMINGKSYEDDAAQISDYYDLLQLTEEMLSARDGNRTATVVSALVQHITKSWRDHFARTVTMKFNCFFLLPFVDEFPFYLRTELDKLYESGVGEMFDIVEARQLLQKKRAELLSECDANSKLQRRFDQINEQLKGPAYRSSANNNNNLEDEDDNILNSTDNINSMSSVNYDSATINADNINNNDNSNYNSNNPDEDPYNSNNTGGSGYDSSDSKVGGSSNGQSGGSGSGSGGSSRWNRRDSNNNSDNDDSDPNSLENV